MEQVVVAPHDVEVVAPLDAEDEIRRLCRLTDHERAIPRTYMSAGATLLGYAQTQGIPDDQVMNLIAGRYAEEGWTQWGKVVADKLRNGKPVREKLHNMLRNLITDADNISLIVEEIISRKMVATWAIARQRIVAAENEAEAAKDRAEFYGELAQEACEEALSAKRQHDEKDAELLVMKFILEITESYAKVSTLTEMKELDSQMEKRVSAFREELHHDIVKNATEKIASTLPNNDIASLSKEEFSYRINKEILEILASRSVEKLPALRLVERLDEAELVAKLLALRNIKNNLADETYKHDAECYKLVKEMLKDLASGQEKTIVLDPECLTKIERIAFCKCASEDLKKATAQFLAKLA